MAIQIDNKPIVGVRELNCVLKEYSGQNDGNGKVVIEFQNQVERVDIVFIAGLFLLCQELEVNKFEIKGSIQKTKQPEIWLYLFQLEKLYRFDTERISFPLDKDTKPHLELYSSSFAPIVYVTKETIDLYFKPLETTRKELSVHLKELSQTHIEKLSNRSEAVSFEEDYFSTEQGQDFKDKLALECPLFIYVFGILYSKDQEKKRAIKANKKLQSSEGDNPTEGDKASEIDNPFKKRLDELWAIAEDYVKGTHELAKNIVEHSSKHDGVLTFRAYDTDNNGKDFDSYVFDFGTQGIVQKLKEDTGKLLKGLGDEKDNSETGETPKSILESDWNLLSGNYRLENFLNPQPTNILRQQIARQFAHIGLLTFNELISENKGTIVASTTFDGKLDPCSPTGTPFNPDEDCIRIGTCFHTQLPMDSPRPRAVPGVYIGPDGLPVSKRLTEVVDYHVERGDYRCSEEDENCIYVVKLVDSRIEKIGNREEERLVVDYYRQLEKQFPVAVTFALDFGGMTLSSSSLLRILACVSNMTDRRIVVYNIDSSLLYGLVVENQRFLKMALKAGSFYEIAYWISGKAILLYSYYDVSKIKDGGMKGHFHFADILYGKNRNDFLLANRKISYSFHNVVTARGSHSPDSPCALEMAASRYFAGEALLPFDILLSTDEKSGCLFLENLKILLQKKFEKVDQAAPGQTLDDYLKKRSGYSISETHFKVGTKYHSDRFIFGKGVFQNSFHTTRLALLVVRGIKKRKPRKDEHITLVGYEMYSELLLGLVEDLLREMGYAKIDHFLVRDTTGGIDKIQNPPERVDKFYIVVPIVSTGSTSIRILRWMEDELLGQNREPEGYFHLISVSDPEVIKSLSLFKDVQPDKFIELDVKWYDPSSCPHCFGENKTPLIEADKTSISPAMVYSLPRVKHPRALDQFEEDLKNHDICEDGYFGVPFDEQRFEGSLLYKCDRRNKEYNVFSHDEHQFIERNREDISSWLMNLRSLLKLEVTDKVVIIAPTRDSNISFINLVNTYLFGYSAIILYLQDYDYIENFKLTAEPYLKDGRSRFKIVFVDDSIITGRSFNNIYNLINVIYETIGNSGNKGPFRFFCTVALINKATADITQRIARQTETLHCFMSVNLPGFMTISEQSPFKLEIKRYEELENYCLFERSKLHYAKKREELEKFSRPDDKGLFSDAKEARHLKMLGATHRLLEYFESHDKDSYDFDEVVKVAGYDEEQDKYSVFKTLCQTPFNLHSDILEAVFKWHTQCLSDLLKNRTTDQVEIVKFMLRRAVFIKNYEVISKEFFEFLANVFGAEEMAEGKEKDKYASLQYFILRQYAELIRINGWCAGQIRDALAPVEFQTWRGRQFKRMMMDSIGIVLHDFNEMLDNTPVYSAWKSIGFDQTEQDVKNFFADSAVADVVKTNKYQIVAKAVPELFTGRSDGQGVQDIFWRYMFVSACLRHDRLPNEATSKKKLKERTRIVLDGIRELFGKKESVGAFFVVKNRRNDKTVVYDRDTEECHILTDAFMTDEKANSFMQTFLEPVSQLSKGEGMNIYSDDLDLRTLIDLRPGSMEEDPLGERWREFECPENAEVFVLPPFRGYKWMYILRMESLRSMREKKRAIKRFEPMGILCVYGKDVASIKDNLGRKLLLMLRKDLSEFVRYHHRNDEFIDLIVAERTERFAYLAGHGRVVMESLTEYKNNEEGLDAGEKEENERIRQNFKAVVHSMERFQYLFATNAIDLSSNDRASWSKVIHDNFYFKAFDGDSLRSIAEDIDLMVKAIYGSDIVEIREDVRYGRCETRAGDFQMEFCRDIVMMIAFELIWNAKKNRFHLVKDLFKSSLPDGIANKLDIELSIDRDKDNDGPLRKVLKLVVSGTGPKVDSDIVNRINGERPIKPDEMNSGLEMLHKVLKVLDQSNSLKMKPGTPENSIYTNTVTVKIYE